MKQNVRGQSIEELNRTANVNINLTINQYGTNPHTNNINNANSIGCSLLDSVQVNDYQDHNMNTDSAGSNNRSDNSHERDQDGEQVVQKSGRKRSRLNN